MSQERKQPTNGSSAQPTQPETPIPNLADLAEWRRQDQMQNDNCDGEPEDPDLFNYY